ncbi:LysR family transcriptional regulator, partial [Mesorhizobium sp. M7A.F.Ca.CA.004.05.1.1]
MKSPLDLDQLQTFISIADTGSFTRAAEEVHRTQSAVSMQMRRLEERLGKPLFEKDGRTNRLTEEGDKLLSYARRLLYLNRETLAAFDDRRLEGTIRIGTPDDYADRFLPEIMARFTRSNPRVELTVICEPTPGLVEHIKRGNLDLALVTHNDVRGQSEVVRREPLLWVTSANHATHEQETLPMAFGRPNCIWRRAAVDVLDQQNRDYRILFTSFSATVITAAVLSGLAISVLPECALRPGMRVL